eukprot:1009906-Pelagomonas_calceolata.AAC.2
MAHPVVESHVESDRLWALPSEPCFARLSRSVSLLEGPDICCSDFPAHRLAHGLVGLGAFVASLQPPIEDTIANGSFL